MGKSLHNQETGFMWTLWHNDWFWGFSSLGPLCCKFNSVAGWDSPAQKSSQLLSPSANLTLSSAPGGWVLLKQKGISKATVSASVNETFTKSNCVFLSVHQTETYHPSLCMPSCKGEKIGKQAVYQNLFYLLVVDGFVLQKLIIKALLTWWLFSTLDYPRGVGGTF